MPFQTVLSPEEKVKIKNAIPQSSNKIFSAALARVYYTHSSPQQWSYSGLQGAIVLSKDNNRGVMSLKLVDIDGTRGVIWEYELYEGFELFQDWGFFHSFPEDDCMIGLVYADEQEAKAFFRKVKLKKDLATVKAPSKVKSKSKKKASSVRGGIDKSMISAPQAESFQHVAHMGYDADTGFSSRGIDPFWLTLFEGLEGKGISRKILAKDMDFIKSFVEQYQGQPKK
ncbi:PH domain-like protein [Macrolepiota fuliginosa MF-IS2]|uniref:PH domain-like protein n=1 Tax=Macrolepiota fuliginosa MF-IS2 TaxID=1400762 RepID=A0A9P5X5G4_9AGAR|nr:PH domain-like protein [Macrolepiota fuliginosa MF-IS2]